MELMELTAHTSSLLRELTETGSRPTGISAIRRGLDGFVTSKTETRASAVLTAKSRVPSGESRIGLVCAPSKFAYALKGTCAEEDAVRTSNTTPMQTI
jgi:hypothetical protein